MELRHLRYFLTVAEALSFSKAAVQLRVAQPALSRQVQDLEDEIGEDLLRRSPRGVTLTAEDKLFLDEVRELLKRHDLAGDELIEGLLNGNLELAVMVKHTDEAATGIEFEELRRYSYCVAMSPGNPLSRKKSFTVEQVAKEPLVGLSRRDYTEYHRILDRLFAPTNTRPSVVVECDSSSSMLTELEAGNHIAIVSELSCRIAGRRLVYRALTNSTESQAAGVARATKGDVTPAGEILRDAADHLCRSVGSKTETRAGLTNLMRVCQLQS